jgi:hypothetical protein
MANNKIGSKAVNRRTVCVEDSDWKELEALVILLKLNGVSSLIRAFLRLVSKHNGLIQPLLLELIEENDRIQPETKSKTLSKTNKFDIKDVIIGAKNNDGN